MKLSSRQQWYPAMSEFDLYHVLDVNPAASFEEIKRSYHSLIKQVSLC